MKVLMQATAAAWQDLAGMVGEDDSPEMQDLHRRIFAVIEGEPSYAPCRIAVDLGEWVSLLPLAKELGLAEEFEQVGTLE